MGTARLTSIDVARAAGVSQTTVSLVMRGVADGRVSPAVQAHVREVAAGLGYRPSPGARMLRSGRANLLALVIPDVTDPFFAAVLRGAQRAAADLDYAVAMIESTDTEQLAETLLAAEHGHVDGIVLHSPNERQLRMARRVIGGVVIVDGGERRGMSSVRYDIAGGTQELVSHLERLGHRRLAHIGGVVDRPSFAERRRELDRVAGDAIGARVEVPFDYEEGLPLVEAFVAKLRRGTAVVCDTDTHAAMAFSAARARDISTPHDLSLIAFNDTNLSRALSLTSIAIPAEEGGRVGVELLLDLLDGATTAKRLLPVRLIDRGSVSRCDGAR